MESDRNGNNGKQKKGLIGKKRPGEKRNEEPEQNKARKLSTKQKKRLENFAERKKKEANRMQVIKSTSEKAIKEDELKLFRPTKMMGQKETKKQKLRRKLNEEKAGIVSADDDVQLRVLTEVKFDQPLPEAPKPEWDPLLSIQVKERKKKKKVRKTAEKRTEEQQKKKNFFKKNDEEEMDDDEKERERLHQEAVIIKLMMSFSRWNNYAKKKKKRIIKLNKKKPFEKRGN
eukprot:TRINITY_DN2948_c0_g1_i1.p1 TRINITY_DN2948_c0_g1~~TRINITY_DN2948_c0_g1_i1.p1  ORF type:complete len:230 (-),score=84.94 TRINITY_DN2948_c0_g1_i1:54-743(-)